MKKQLLSISLAVVTCLGVNQVYAQGESSDITKALGDADLLMNAYLSPFMKAFGTGLNAGWFNTAKPHGIGGFDITVSTNAPFAPTSDQTYDVSKLGMKNVRLTDPSQSGISQTVFGAAKEGPEVGVYTKSPVSGNDTLIAKFNTPQGSGFNFGVVPTAQLSVGVGFGTEVAIRYSPELSLGSANAGLFGFAVKHDVKQWIPGIKEMPFDLSVMFGYTSIHASVKMEPQMDNSTPTDTIMYNAYSNKKYTNQKVELESKGWTANVLLSKKLGPITPYLGLGYQTSSSSLKLSGTYPVMDVNPEYTNANAPVNPSTGVPNPSYDYNNPNSHPMAVREVKDPVNIKGDVSDFRATIGLRLKLAILTIHGDYTFASYNVASLGIGLNIQSIVPFKM